LNSRESEIRRKLTPVQSWLERRKEPSNVSGSLENVDGAIWPNTAVATLDAITWVSEFYEDDVAIFCGAKPELDSEQKEALTGRLEGERARLVRLIEASSAPDEDQALLLEVIRDEFDKYRRLILDGQ
jgi:hypothetical protein